MKKKLAIFSLLLATNVVQAFGHDHTAWNSLLERHVVLIGNGNASQVDYAGILSDRVALKDYLDGLSAVTDDEYQRWSKTDRLAFLINAYNAFTIELILSKYPDIQSIKELGSLFRSPWKKRFFTLLGKTRYLDELEHDMIRAPGVFDDPRIHFAVNCASVGCPMLRKVAYTGKRLDTQLQDGMRRFLSDRTRNRFDVASGRLQVSKIFDWYDKDFEQGHQGFTSLNAIFAKYADSLADETQARQRIRSGDYRIKFLEYDWQLNDVPR
jgi:hypothetical protein